MKNIKSIHLLLALLAMVIINYGCSQTTAQTAAKKPLIVFVTGDH